MSEHYVRAHQEEATYHSGQHETRENLKGFYITLYCNLVDGSKQIAWFASMVDAIIYGADKAHSLAISFQQDIPIGKAR